MKEKRRKQKRKEEKRLASFSGKSPPVLSERASTDSSKREKAQKSNPKIKRNKLQWVAALALSLPVYMFATQSMKARLHKWGLYLTPFHKKLTHLNKNLADQKRPGQYCQDPAKVEALRESREAAVRERQAAYRALYGLQDEFKFDDGRMYGDRAEITATPSLNMREDDAFTKQQDITKMQDQIRLDIDGHPVDSFAGRALSYVARRAGHDPATHAHTINLRIARAMQAARAA